MITNVEYLVSKRAMIFADETSTPRAVWKYDAVSRQVKPGRYRFSRMHLYLDGHRGLLGMMVSLDKSVTHLQGVTFIDGVQLIAKMPKADGADLPFRGYDAGNLGKDLERWGKDNIMFTQPATLLYERLLQMTVKWYSNQQDTSSIGEFRPDFYLLVS